MNTLAHTFPLPEAETTKLEAVTGQLGHHPAYKRFEDHIRAKPWRWVLIVALLGVLTGLWGRSHN